MEAKAVKTSTRKNILRIATEDVSYAVIKRGIENNPTSKSAKDKLIRRKEARLRRLCSRNIQMVKLFPKTIRVANDAKHQRQNTFHELKFMAAG